jgi:hypothetical protein
MSSTWRSKGGWAALALVVVTVFAAHFWRLRQFGLYEDDYWSIAPNLGASAGDLWVQARYVFTHFPQGRPLNHLLPHLLAASGSALAGLRGVYLLAAAWLVLNGVLVWMVGRRLLSRPGALILAATYLLFPADSTRILLTHAAHVQGAMTFLLLGILLWLQGGWRRVLSYPVAALCLLAYESTYLPFLAVPLLVQVERTRFLRTWVIHAGGVALFVGLAALIRLTQGESRVLDVAGNPVESLRRMVTSLWLGPSISGRALWRAAYTGLRQLDGPATIAAALVVAALLAAFWYAVLADREQGAPPQGPGGHTDRLPTWRLLIAGLLTWSLAYALTLTNYPPTQEVGRLTSTHVAAAWPVALVVAALFDLARGATRWRSRLVVLVTVAWMAALVGYQHMLQRGYVRAWEQQRRFWKELTLRTPDVGPGWTVVLTGSPSDSNPVIRSNAWSDHHVHRQIYQSGHEPATTWFAHLGSLNEKVSFEQVGEAWRWRPEFWGGPWVELDRTRLALFEDDRGSLRRVEAIETPAGTLRTLAPLPTTTRTSWPDTPVSRLLFPEVFRLE